MLDNSNLQLNKEELIKRMEDGFYKKRWELTHEISLELSEREEEAYAKINQTRQEKSKAADWC